MCPLKNHLPATVVSFATNELFYIILGFQRQHFSDHILKPPHQETGGQHFSIAHTSNTPVPLPTTQLELSTMPHTFELK